MGVQMPRWIQEPVPACGGCWGTLTSEMKGPGLPVKCFSPLRAVGWVGSCHPRVSVPLDLSRPGVPPANLLPPSITVESSGYLSAPTG